jgi:hypothetical protein
MSVLQGEKVQSILCLLPHHALLARRWVPDLVFCIAHFGAIRLRDSKETQCSYANGTIHGGDPPSLQATPSKDDSCPVFRHPQATWAGSQTHLFLGGAQDVQRVRVTTALCRTRGEV